MLLIQLSRASMINFNNCYSSCNQFFLGFWPLSKTDDCKDINHLRTIRWINYKARSLVSAAWAAAMMFCRIRPFWSIHQRWIYAAFNSFVENNGLVGTCDPAFEELHLQPSQYFFSLINSPCTMNWYHCSMHVQLTCDPMAPQQQFDPFLLAAFCTKPEFELLLQPDVGTVDASLCVFCAAFPLLSTHLHRLCMMQEGRGPIISHCLSRSLNLLFLDIQQRTALWSLKTLINHSL